MAETLISPGVLARENDSSFVSQQPVTVGAAIIGPTVKGPVEIPTVVTTYSDYVNRFGTTFLSGGQEYSYLTSIAAYNYFQQGGQSLLVARVASGSFTSATASIVNSETVTGTEYATGSFTLNAAFVAGIEVRLTTPDSTLYRFIASDAPIPADDEDGKLYFYATGSTATATATNLAAEMDAALDGLFNVTSATADLIISSSAIGTTYNGTTVATGSASTFTTQVTLGGGSNGSGTSLAFTLKTISEGIVMNSVSTEGTNGILPSGSADNVRWQITNSNTSSGTFDLLVRQGNDTATEPIVLETWTNLSLDPTQPNYISRVIGDSYQQYNSTDNYVEVLGNFPTNSRYVYVNSVDTPTPYYFDNNGTAKSIYANSLPSNASGSFGSALGSILTGTGKYYNNITSTDTQGLVGANYNNMIALMANQDDYRFNAISIPGLTIADNASQVTTLVNAVQGRGDAIAVIDTREFGASISEATTSALTINSSYAATYWPWLQTIDPGTGQLIWVPASTLIPAVYAFNDSVSEPWFAPAGINRGGLDTVVRAERKLSQTNRNNLYTGNVNPIATFPGTGVVVYGQKTLQKRASALDRVNVRRLLIALKSYISQVANNLVFEQNTIATRNQFLSQVNPYLESVQQRQGLYAFRVIMDDSNNTPDVIDRNQLIGQIYLQPTKTAEFIYLDFNILPTGATFPA